jgi:tripartite ATP-independent transporter DctM subunit
MVSGVPIYACLGVTGLCGTAMLSGWKVAVTMLKNFPYMRAADYIMMVVPMFIMMGYIAFAAGLSKDAYKIANNWLSRLPAGIAMATVMASAMFGACCGSSVACSATMGKVAIPEMTEKGYNPKVSAGVVAAGGLLGIMIPPSTILVFYGTLAEVSVGQMLLAGVIPGIVTAIIYSLGLFFWSKFDKTLCPSTYKVSWKDRIWSLRLIWGVIVLFAIIVGGIYGGVVTPTEAAAIGAVACFLMMLLKTPKAERKYMGGYIMEALKETVNTCGMIFMILICSALFSVFMTTAGIPAMVNAWASSLPLSPLMIVGLFLVILIPMGMFLDPFSCLVITVPITYPVVVGTFGFDPLWYGILLTLMIQIGLITPPVGLNAYVMKGACPDLSLEDIFKGCFPFIFFTLATVLVILFLPQVATWLPYSIK